MKILCLVHGYPEFQNAGAEWMLHEMMRYLVKRGHGVEVLVPVSRLEPYNFEGVSVRKDDWSYTQGIIPNCDLIISHLDRSGRALNLAEFYHKPFVQIIHNSNLVDILNSKHKPIGQGRFIYVIYNTDWLQKEMHYLAPGLVVHPPVDPLRYKINDRIVIKPVGKGKATEIKVPKPKKKITLINLFERKGGVFFHDLARLMPDYEFLGVEGGYGRQEKQSLPNVTYMENVPDARRIYSQTRILLMPSKYESYGRTGIEAMCSGIPVIANPTPGLKESLGDAGIFCSIESPLKWIEAIKKLDSEKEYKIASDKSLARVDELDSGEELAAMEGFLNNIIEKRI